MGQYKSYQDTHLANRVHRAQQQLMQIKAIQKYGMNQVQAYQSNSFTYGCVVYSHMSEWGYESYGSGTDIYHLRFTGDKPTKTVIGRLKFDLNSDGHTYNDVNYIKEIRGATPNITEWWVFVNGSGETSPSWSVTISAITNEKGKLEVVESYSILDNYQWITGGYYP